MGSFAGAEEEGPSEDLLDEGAAKEAIEALCSLGYTAEEVRPVVRSLAAGISDTGTLIRASLREIGKAGA